MAINLEWPLHATLLRSTFGNHSIAAIHMLYSNIWLSQCQFEDSSWSVLDTEHDGSVYARGLAPANMDVGTDSVFQFTFPPPAAFPSETDASLQHLHKVLFCALFNTAVLFV